jgi:hypothetical protein
MTWPPVMLPSGQVEPVLVMLSGVGPYKSVSFAEK